MPSALRWAEAELHTITKRCMAASRTPCFVPPVQRSYAKDCRHDDSDSEEAQQHVMLSLACPAFGTSELKKWPYRL